MEPFGGLRGGPAAKARKCEAAKFWARVAYFSLLMLFVILSMAFSVGVKQLDWSEKARRDVPVQLFFAVADGVSSANTSCYQLTFGARAASGALCVNPTTRRVAWHVEVRDAAFTPPVDALVVHGPGDAEALALDARAHISGEPLLVGLLPAPDAARIVADADEYHVELRARGATARAQLA